MDWIKCYPSNRDEYRKILRYVGGGSCEDYFPDNIKLEEGQFLSAWQLGTGALSGRGGFYIYETNPFVIKKYCVTWIS